MKNLNNAIKLLGQKLPPKAQIEKLIQAWALKIFSGRQEAPIKAQQRYHDKFEMFYDKMVANYPHIDFTSDSFWSSITSKAEEWWRSRPFSGGAVDW